MSGNFGELDYVGNRALYETGPILLGQMHVNRVDIPIFSAFEQ